MASKAQPHHREKESGILVLDSSGEDPEMLDSIHEHVAVAAGGDSGSDNPSTQSTFDAMHHAPHLNIVSTLTSTRTVRTVRKAKRKDGPKGMKSGKNEKPWKKRKEKGTDKKRQRTKT
jgi:hypothetical protein